MSDNPTDVLAVGLSFMTLTFLVGAVLYWAYDRLRRPPPG